MSWVSSSSRDRAVRGLLIVNLIALLLLGGFLVWRSGNREAADPAAAERTRASVRLLGTKEV